MKQFFASDLTNLSAIVGQIEGLKPSQGDLIDPGQIVPSAISAIEATASHCREIGLPASAASLHRIVGLLTSQGPVAVAPLVKECGDVRSRIQDELAQRIFLSVDLADERYFTDAAPFGEAVSEAFQSARRDIAEAGLCLALARHTAAVFHLMRVVEFGLRAVAASLADPSLNPDTNPTWNTLLNRFDGELKKSFDKRTPEWRTDPEFFAGVAARLHSLKDAWRNPTMHITGTYNAEEARDIYNNVRGFMQHLATRLHE